MQLLMALILFEITRALRANGQKDNLTYTKKYHMHVCMHQKI